MIRTVISLGVILPLLFSCLTSTEAAEKNPAKPAWGSLEADPLRPGVFRATVDSLPADGLLPLPLPFPHIVRCELAGKPSPAAASEGDTAGGAPTVPLFEFNKDASSLTLIPPKSPLSDKGPLQLLLHTAQKSDQLADGRIVLHAADSAIEGKSAKRESHPGNERIGFWTDPADSVSWVFPASRWGKYSAWLVYSADAGGSVVAVDLGAGETEVRKVKLPPTGSWYRYGSIPLGEIYYPKAEKRTIRVRAVEKSGAAVMNLKAVCLVPACEGKPPVQGDDGTITLHSRDATVHGVMLRYEPDPKKITLGYWVRPTDAASWQFEVRNPGEFEVEVHQGCGTGQGGSEVAVSLGDQKLTFVVEETGHFQNFKPRTIGRIKIPAAGWSELRVGPTKIAKGAALDIRQIILRPVTSASP